MLWWLSMILFVRLTCWKHEEKARRTERLKPGAGAMSCITYAPETGSCLVGSLNVN
jgi:hypothetical protein